MKILCVLLLSASLAFAAPVAYVGVPYVSLNAASAAAIGSAYVVPPQVYSYTWSLTTSGTVSAVTVNLEGSLDGVNWYALDVANTSDANWSAGEMRHIVNKPTLFLRLNLVSITGGGSITGKIVLFH